MKRLLVLFLLLMITACDVPTDTPPQEINCDIYPTHKDCKEDEEPIVDNGDAYPGSGGYENLGYGSEDVYTARDLVPDDCDHLDNIGMWQPVWCEEFEYTGLPDDDKWNYDVGGHGWGNGELQYYTNKDEDNAYVSNGVLTITTIRETFDSNAYTSARIVTRDKGDWLYGKIQVRAKVPEGLGTWPAIWMLPTDWEYGGWPTSGEIDIMEYVGYQPNTIHGTIHTGKYNHSLGTQLGRSRTVATAEEEFHVYEMEWEVGVIRLYVDGILYVTFDYDPEDNTDVDSFQAWPFDKQFHLLINTAFGGAWGGAQGIDPEIMPVEFVIDYVRVYQKDYAGMDETAPNAVTNLSALEIKSDKLYVAWDKAIDDVMVKEYHIYVDDVLTASTTVNGHLLDGLQPSTSYDIKVIAEDFAGHLSIETTVTFTTTAPPTINNRIEAEDYDNMSGVQTENTQDTGGGLNVGWVDTDDYMEYVLQVTESGNYQIEFRIASESNGAHLEIYQDDVLIGTMDSPATGSWQTWDSFYSSVFELTPGTYTFKLVATDSGFNINYFDFRKVS